MRLDRRLFYFSCARVLGVLVIASLVRPGLVAGQVKGAVHTPTPSGLMIHLSSSLGIAPTNVGDLLWGVKLMAGFPIFKGPNLIWIGIMPTMVLQDTGLGAALDGFLPVVVEYERDLGTSLAMSTSTTKPFLYVNAGAGPQYGNHSDHRVFQAVMFSAGVGLRDGISSGFMGQLGVNYNNVPPIAPRTFVVLNAGIFF